MGAAVVETRNLTKVYRDFWGRKKKTALNALDLTINKGEIFRFVAKPWLREEMLATVRNALQRHELITHNEVLQARTQQLNAQLMTANAELQARVEAARRQLERRSSAG